MPVTMIKKYDLNGEYQTNEEKNILIDMIDSFRTQMNDFEAKLNLLNGKKLQYDDRTVLRFLKEGLKDLNRGVPKTHYTLFNIQDPDLVVRAAVVVSTIAEGVLQLRNQIDYSDSGFTVAMFNKTASYQGWAGFFLQTYFQDKKDFKSSIIVKGPNSGFVGVGTQFGYRTR